MKNRRAGLTIKQLLLLRRACHRAPPLRLMHRQPAHLLADRCRAQMLLNRRLLPSSPAEHHGHPKSAAVLFTTSYDNAVSASAPAANVSALPPRNSHSGEGLECLGANAAENNGRANLANILSLRIGTPTSRVYGGCMGKDEKKPQGPETPCPRRHTGI